MKFLPSKESIKSVAKYISLGAAVFAIGLLWNFPYEKIRDTLTNTLTRKTGYQIDMATLSPALPIGFKATSVRIQGPPIGARPVDLELHRLRVTASPFSLLLYPFRKSITLWYSADLDQNSWSGKAALGRDHTSIELNTKNFKLRQSLPLQEVNPLFAGADLTISANLSLTTSLSGGTPLITRGDLSTSNGLLTFSATDMTLKGPIINEVKFDKVLAEAQLKEGKLEIQSISLSGPDITGTANGSLKVEPYFPRSQIRLEAKLTLSERMKALRDLISTLGQQIGLRINEQGTMALRVEGPITPMDRLFQSVQGF